MSPEELLTHANTVRDIVLGDMLPIGNTVTKPTPPLSAFGTSARRRRAWLDKTGKTLDTGLFLSEAARDSATRNKSLPDAENAEGNGNDGR